MCAWLTGSSSFVGMWKVNSVNIHSSSSKLLADNEWCSSLSAFGKWERKLVSGLIKILFRALQEVNLL